MSFHERNILLPSSHRMIDAYKKVHEWHLSIGDTIERILQTPADKVVQATADFFKGGVAYLANRGHDDYIREIGCVSWEALQEGDVAVKLTTDLPQTARFLKVSAPKMNQVLTHPKEPFVYLKEQADDQRKVVYESATILLPLEFLVGVIDKPLQTLAQQAAICSRIRDLFFARLAIDPQNIAQRSDATRAHFLHHVVELHPETSPSLRERQLMAKYPKGINSLKPSQRYVRGGA